MTLDEVIQQEKDLVFPAFSHELALDIGLRAIDKVKKAGTKGIGVRIIDQGLLVFQYLMDGKKEDTWLKRKERTVYATGHSGMYSFLKKDEYATLAQDDQYVLCGGGFPLVVNGELRGAICFSGLPHEEDHALIVDVLREVLM